MNYRLLFLLFILLTSPVFSSSEFAAAQAGDYPERVNSFKEALKVTFENNPGVAALWDRKRSLAALKKQAGYLPNPEVELEAENFGGDLSGYDEAETTLVVSQLIELGGKRSARSEEAAGKEELFEVEALTDRIEIAAELKKAFSKVQLYEALEALSREGVKIARKTEAAVRKRVEKGATLKAEHTKAKMEVEMAELVVLRAEQDLEAAKTEFASFWGGSPENVGSLGAMQVPADDVAELGAFDANLSPFAGVSSARIKAAERNLKVQNSLAVPDITLAGGYRRSEETSDHAFVAALSIPLPMFDRNSGEIASAQHELAAEKKHKLDLERRLGVVIKNLQKRLRVQLAEILALRRSVLPAAQQSFQGFQRAFEQGRSSFLEFLDAQGAFLETKRREQELRFSALESQIELQKFMGTIIPQDAK